MNPLAAYLEGRDPEDVAADLSAKLDKNLTPAMVKMWASRKAPPKAWAEALGLAPSEPDERQAPLFDHESGDEPEPSGRRSETPPRAPEGAKLAPSSFQLTAQAKERIAAIHVFAGSAVATAVDADGFENDRGVGGGVAKLWADKSDPIAAAWIEWAQEGNRFAQAFVRMMSTGGAGGNLAMGYAALLGGTAYIIGHLPDNEATRLVYGRYTKYRPVDAQPAGDEPERGRGTRDNGSAPAGAGDPLAGATSAARS